MKEFRTIFAAGTICFAIACKGEIREPVVDNTPTDICVGIDEATRTVFGDLTDGRRPVLWTNGDQICVNGITSSAAEGLQAPCSMATFHFDKILEKPYNILYPASIYSDASTVTLDAKAVNGVLPLGGRGLTVKALTSVVKLNIVKAKAQPALQKVKLTSKGGVQLCGPFSIDYSTATLTGVDSSEPFRSIEMTLDSADQSADTLRCYLPVPQGSYGFKVCVTDVEGRYMEKETSSAKTLVKGCIHSMPAFVFSPTGTRVCLVEDNVQQYSVAIPVNASSTERVVATKIAKSLGTLTGTILNVTSASSSADVKEIIVGLDSSAPERYGNMTYGNYSIRRDGNKILVGAFDLNAYSAAASYLDKCFTDNYSCGDLCLEDNLFKDGTISDVKGYVPPFKTDKAPSKILQTGANCDKDVAMQVEFTMCKDADFDSYCAALENASYTKKCGNAFGKCRYASYIGNGYQISVALYNATGMLRIVSEPAYAKPIWTIEGTPGNVNTLMMQVCQDNVKIVPGSHPCAYIVRLSDGRYFVYDTGDTTAADQLIDYMRSRNTFTDGKIHIAMMIISHPHYDHMGGIGVFASKYASEIVCEAVGFNMTNHTRQSLYALSTLHGRLNEIINAAKKLGATPYCLRGGQVVNLAGARLEVLFTPDELGTYFLSGVDEEGNTSTNYDQNNSSNIVRLTVGGQRITFTGDCRGGEAGIFNSTLLSGFESEIMTAAHHGFNVSATAKMYLTAEPFVIFWPVHSTEQDMTRSFDKQLMALESVKKHFFEDTQVEIPLPYSVD